MIETVYKKWVECFDKCYNKPSYYTKCSICTFKEICENKHSMEEKPILNQICIYESNGKCKICKDGNSVYYKDCREYRTIEVEQEYQPKTKRSRNIPKTVQREVWRRDMGRCVDCGSNERLEYDHIIPFSKGGSNTARNIQLLCEACNRSKYNYI
ncbi:hypothetical protein LCGC14_0672720 [marine sediment metagenome]|uniref:HNH nuclease domain-containing protein n=1 Tax=marine sediment metagenome TaxID=412755 RepID=A0A0F9TYJ5_9ZZZZ